VSSRGRTTLAPGSPAPLPNWLSWFVSAEVGEVVRREGKAVRYAHLQSCLTKEKPIAGRGMVPVPPVPLNPSLSRLPVLPSN